VRLMKFDNHQRHLLGYRNTFNNINKRTFITTRFLLRPNGETNAKPEDTKPEDAEQSPPPDPRDTKIKEQEQKIQEFEKMIEELRNGWRSAVAEQDNIRKRAQKEIDRAKEFGVEKLCKHLFSVSDTMNIIIQNKPNFDLTEHQENLLAKSAFEGIEQVKGQFLSALTDAYEIEESYPKLGDNFDPLQHNALFEVDSPSGVNIPAGKVGLVVKSAWKRKGTLLRPASVGVVKAKPAGSQSPPPPPPPKQKPQQQQEQQQKQQPQQPQQQQSKAKPKKEYGDPIQKEADELFGKYN